MAKIYPRENTISSFKWERYGMGTCSLCQETKGGWYLECYYTQICLLCVNHVTTMKLQLEEIQKNEPT